MLHPYPFLILIALLGVLIVREDFTGKKIKNKYIFGGFGLEFFLLCLYLGLGFVNISYLGQVASNLIIAFIVAFLIWRSGFWSAGDGKLFILLAFLLPLNYYSLGRLPFFPAFALLANTFFSFLFVITLQSLVFLFFYAWQTGKHQGLLTLFRGIKNSIVKAIARQGWKKTIKIILFQLLFSLVFVLALSYLYLDRPVDFKSFWLYLLAFFLIRASVNFLLEKKRTEEINYQAINPGYSLADSNLNKFLEKDKNLKNQLGCLLADGLNAEQVDILQKYCSEKNITKLYINKTISFSNWLFAGTLITIIIRGIFRF